MPNIRTFEAPNLGIQPSETGVQATAQAANRIGRFYDQAASATATVGRETAAVGESFARGLGAGVSAIGDQVVKYAEHREISHGAAAYAELNDNLTQAWNQTAQNADPNDPSVAAKFRETVLEPALEKYRDAFNTEGGQRFAEARIDALRNHMFEKTTADMSSLAKDAVAVNMRTTANSLSNTASSDPSSVPHLLDSADGLVGDMVTSAPNLKGADASRAKMELTQKMKEAIVKSGAIGAIAKSGNPEATAEQWGKQYPEYISGDDLKMLAANARQQIRAARTDAAYVDHLRKLDQQDKSDARENDYLKNLYSGDPQQQSNVSTKAVVNDPLLKREAKERLINVVNREMKPETDAKISARTSVGFMRQIADPNADPDQITKALYDARSKDPGEAGSLTKADFADLQKQLLDRKTPEGLALTQDRSEFFKRYSGTIDGYLAQSGLHSALGSQKVYAAQKDAMRMEQMLRSKGQDPHSLYDPSSPNFFGRPENLRKYQVSMEDAMKYGNEIGKAPMNLTGPGTTITGVSVENAPAFKPPAGWQFSPSRQQYRDPSGTLYDISGKPVKK